MIKDELELEKSLYEIALERILRRVSGTTGAARERTFKLFREVIGSPTVIGVAGVKEAVSRELVELLFPELFSTDKGGPAPGEAK